MILWSVLCMALVGQGDILYSQEVRLVFYQENNYKQKNKETTYLQRWGNVLDRKLDYWASEDGIEMMFMMGLGTVGYAAFMYTMTKLQESILGGKQDMQIFYPGDITTKFSDVAGLHEAKADVQDIVSYLQDPKKYTDKGAKVPKGVLMNGGPGNGKTLLAKAVAGEVNCPFISISGSSFIQMFVGVGAARVRDLFLYANLLSARYGACIIFIDEIDAVGQKRGVLNSHVEYEQTLNQLLQCMDGINAKANPIIVLGATNRVDSLDEALIRPGRFDRVVEVTKPNYADRVELVNISLRTLQYASDMDVCRIARGTRGFSGAQLANLFNEAVILAANEDRDTITMQDVDTAFDNIILGRPKNNMDIPEQEQWRTAVHEAGHCAGFLFNQDIKYAIHKVSVTPRSQTLGFVYPILLQENVNPTILSMKAELIMLLCGGLAEQACGLSHSTGLSNDLLKARALAYEMVVYHGMGENLSYISYAQIDKLLPNDIATKVHQEIENIIIECREQARALIAAHKDDIEKIARLLIEKGTVVGNEVYELVGLPLPAGIEFSLS